MKIFFAGNSFGIGGPCEVNKNLVAGLGKNVSSLSFSNKCLRVVEYVIKLLLSKIIVFSALSNLDHIFAPFAKKMGKKIIYIMHGCLEMETKANNYSNERGVISEQVLLSYADRILCVSPFFQKMMEKRYPVYQSKFDYLMNGINWSYMDQIATIEDHLVRDRNRILLMGGGRVTKRNLSVCKAVQNLNERENLNLQIDLYGHYDESGELLEILKIPCVSFHKVIPHSEILRELKCSSIFIQNSEFEPFSMGVVEALMCGCDLLISQFVGAKDVISSLTEEDIIKDPLDIKEIQNKIMKLVLNPNNRRLLASIDRKKTGIDYAADKLLEKIESI